MSLNFCCSFAFYFWISSSLSGTKTTFEKEHTISHIQWHQHTRENISILVTNSLFGYHNLSRRQRKEESKWKSKENDHLQDTTVCLINTEYLKKRDGMNPFPPCGNQVLSWRTVLHILPRNKSSFSCKITYSCYFHWFFSWLDISTKWV